MSDVSGAVLLLLLFFAVIGLAEILMRKGRLPAEIARKLIHLSGGLGCLLFPFLVSSWITVLFLAVVFASIFYLGENRKMLKSLSSVERRSCGSLLFPVAILILFILSEGRLWLYISALLVLVLADTAAALAGTRFGRIFYQTAPGEKKSAEGTAMFCLVGFFAVYLPLLFLSDIPHLTCILTAALMALLLGSLEAVSIGGTDNLFVPLATSFLLLKLPTKPQPEILFQCLSFIGISLFVFIANRRHQTLQPRPLIIFILTTYAAWSLGSADWMIPVITGFIIYNRSCMHCAPLPEDLSARELLRPLYPALFILFTANATLKFYFWFAPFVVAMATASSLCIVNRYRREIIPQRLRGRTLTTAAIWPGASSLLLCLPIQGWNILVVLPVLIPLCAVTTLAYNRFCKSPVTNFAWNYSIPLCAAAASLTVAGLQHVGIIQPLNPSTWMEVFR
ncbi:MAG: hypothetical protein WC701_06345 [Kiritimatiellales bacterium]|jgi:phytol kinase